MKAIYIDAVNKTVETIEHSGEWKDIVRTLGCEYMCNVNVRLGLYSGSLVIDDEGLLKEPKQWFTFKNCGYQWFAGSGLLFDSNEEGDYEDCSAYIEDIQNLIVFADSDGETMLTSPEIHVVSFDNDGSIKHTSIKPR